MNRRSPLFLAVPLLGQFAVGAPSLLARDPYEEAVGSFEIVETELRRVDALTVDSLDVSYPRYDAPKGMTFLAVRWTLKPTYEKDVVHELASIPHDALFAETPTGKLPAIGQLDHDDDAFRPGYPGTLAVKREDSLPAYVYCPVFVVPRDAEEVTLHAGKLRAKAKLEGEILPCLGWRDAMTIEALDVSEFFKTKTEEEIYDGESQLSYVIEHEFAVPAKSLVAAKLRILPKRPTGPEEESPFCIEPTDFRIDRGQLPPTPPVAKIEDGDLDRLRGSVCTRADDDGVMQPIEMTLVFPIYEPTKRIALTFRGAPVGEFDVELAAPNE